jgi:hypothetical protein
MKCKIQTLLEEAIKAWELEIRELKHTAEWINEETNTHVNLKNSIKHKKELIDSAKIILKEGCHEMENKTGLAGKG